MTEPLPPIVAEITIDRICFVVWQRMISEAGVTEWLGCMSFRPEVGSLFYMQPDPARRATGDIAGATHCRIVELVEPLRFSFAWFIPGTPETMVTITLTPDGPMARRTIVRLTHEGWEQFPPEMVKPFHDQLKSGWSGSVLPGLKALGERP